MQKRWYSNDDGYRTWLNPAEQSMLLDVYRGEELNRLFALMLGLHGLRSEEILHVRPADFRALDGEREGHKLYVRKGKRHRQRECPVSREVVQLASYSGVNADESVVQVTTKTLRDWIQTAREQLRASTGDDDWQYVGMHDLRRTWATTTFYTLAFDGNPIAEELTMGWGGWKMTDSGRQTFRENYLGPEPDFIAGAAMETLSLPE